MDKLKEFIDSRNEAYQKEIFPYICKQTELDSEKLVSDSSSETLGNIIGSVSGNSLRSANYISLVHLKAYHQWLQENYELTPKK